MVTIYLMSNSCHRCGKSIKRGQEYSTKSHWYHRKCHPINYNKTHKVVS